MTLLDIVQEILSSMDSDEVNSITDTTEAMQVAVVVRRAYLDLAHRLNLPEQFDLFRLTASGDNDLPTVMFRPASVDQLLWIKYDKRLEDDDPPSYKDITYMEPKTFFDRMHMMNEDDTVISSSAFPVDGVDFTILYFNDRHPNYWTSLDDYTILFDAHKLDIDTTLQSSKTQCYGLKNEDFELEDEYEPPLDGQQFSLLVNDAKALAWAELKQTSHDRAEREAKRQLIQTQKNKRALPGKHAYGDLPNLPNYGRK